MTYRTSYFQIVAYKEGWTFDPDKYQVIFVSPDDPRLLKSGEGSILRLLNYKDEDNNEGILGFESRDDQKTFVRLGDTESHSLFKWFSKLFGLK